MGRRNDNDLRLHRGSLAGGTLIAIVGLLASLAVVYSNADGVGKVAEEAAAQQQAEAALGALAAARATLSQVLLLDPAQAATMAEVVSDSKRLLDEVQLRLDPLGPGFTAPAATVQQAAADFLARAESGDLSGAADLAVERVGPALDDLTTRVAAQRDQSAAAIAAARAQIGRLATAARFLVALGIPGATALGWVLLARRRRRRVALTEALEKERELSRAKDQLLANISHELRTPLTGIYAAARTIETTGYGDEALAGELNGIIVDQSADLNRMIDDLLVSARSDIGRLRFDSSRVAVHEEVRTVITEFRRCGKSIAVDCTPALVLADPLRLRQVLRNLVSNAVRHGGPVITLIGRPDGQEFSVAVGDNGPGVPAHVEARLFTRFIHSGDRPLITGSVGLGLAITRLLAEGMGGTVAHERRDDQTWFTVRLPAAPPADSVLAPSELAADHNEPPGEAAGSIPQEQPAEPQPASHRSPRRFPKITRRLHPTTSQPSPDGNNQPTTDDTDHPAPRSIPTLINGWAEDEWDYPGLPTLLADESVDGGRPGLPRADALLVGDAQTSGQQPPHQHG